MKCNANGLTSIVEVLKSIFDMFSLGRLVHYKFIHTLGELKENNQSNITPVEAGLAVCYSAILCLHCVWNCPPPSCLTLLNDYFSMF